MLARHYIHVLCHANAYNPSRKQPYSRTINVQTHIRYRCSVIATEELCSRTTLV